MGCVQKPPIRLSEGVVIAAAPALGYLFAYLYRRGFASQLRIPLEFVQVEPSDVLFATVGTLAIAAVILPLAHVMLSIGEVLPGDRRWRLAYVLGLIWLALTAIDLFIFRNHLYRVWPSSISTAVIALSAAWSAWSDPPPTLGLVRIGERHLGTAGVLGVPVVLVACLSFLNAGTARALDQREFLVVPSTDEAVLAVYGRTAVLAPHSDGQLRDRFRLVGVEGLELERRRIGPLKPPKKVPAPSSEPVDPARQAP